MTLATASIEDQVNRRILAISEDRLQGFHPDPIGEIAARTGLERTLVVERLQGMLEAGVIRRIRQTLLSTSLAHGALVAWEVPPDRLQAAFDYMFQDDPFSGHVVIRSTDGETAGSQYRLWTTVKVPQGFSIERHASLLAGRVGAVRFRLMPARKLFALGVGHTRRRGMAPGSRAQAPAEVIDTDIVRLDDLQWRVLTALKREFTPPELEGDPWAPRADEAGVPLATFIDVARGLQRIGVLGRFSTFLEHVKELPTGERVTRYNGLFHWAVPPGCEIAAGQQVARHHINPPADWREAGPEVGNVNVMAVAHGMEKKLLLEHKAAIDLHLSQAAIAVGYTNVFWGGRSEIKPSEISPLLYADWCIAAGLDPETMRDPGDTPK